jgi:uncharacterized protein (TIRG00374 family)
MEMAGQPQSGIPGRPSRDLATPVRDSPCSDCLGRDLFGGYPRPLDVPEEPLPEPSRHGLRQFFKEHRSLIGLLVFAAVVTGFVVGVLPQITGLGTTLRRLGRGNLSWLLVGVVLESVSLAGYVALFRAVLSDQDTRIGWRASYEITLAGVVATKLFAAAGAGGLALTAWALRSAGLSARSIAQRLAGFEIILYAVFMVALVVVGALLGFGVVGAGAPWTLSFLPAGFGALVIGLALAARRIPQRLEQSANRVTSGPRWLGKVLARLATVPAAIRDGMVEATELVKVMNPGLLGAVVYWGFDIATLWAAFRAFGTAPPVAVVIMAYYVGQLANAIPLPGGIGGVEGGMIGCFAALDVNAGAALVAVFAYRAISFWLPTLPGAVAYLQLRRRVAAWRAREASGRPAAS